MRFAFFPLHLSKVPRLPWKSDARSYEVLHLSRKIILKIWGSKMQPLSGNQRPDLLTALMNMSLALRLPRKMHLCRSSSNVPRLPSFLEILQNPYVLLTFDQFSTILCACHAKPHLNVQKWSEPLVSFNILTSKCASRHNAVHFFDIATSKSAPKLKCFCTVWLGNALRATTACTFPTSQLPKVVRTWCALCILTWKLRATTPCTFPTSQLPKVVRTWCALCILTWKCASHHNAVHFFDITTSKSAPKLKCFCTFWLGNVLRATTACTFPTSQLPKVVRAWCALCILTWKCASRHNGVQFFISHLASGLRTRRFSEPTFRPSGATNYWINTVFRGFPTLSRTWIFFLLRLSLFWSSFFFSSLLWLFPPRLFICPYCRKFDF